MLQTLPLNAVWIEAGLIFEDEPAQKRPIPSFSTNLLATLSQSVTFCISSKIKNISFWPIRSGFSSKRLLLSCLNLKYQGEQVFHLQNQYT